MDHDEPDVSAMSDQEYLDEVLNCAWEELIPEWTEEQVRAWIENSRETFLESKGEGLLPGEAYQEAFANLEFDE